jgi:hypothetical protein
VLLPFTIAPMDESERNLVLATWMRTSWAHRSHIVRQVDHVHVARSPDGLCMGWIAASGDTVHHGWVRDGYRELGLMRALWEHVGKPCVLGRDPTTRAKRVLRSLLDGQQKEAS